MSCPEKSSSEAERDQCPQPFKDPFPLLSFQDPLLGTYGSSTPQVLQSLPRRAITTWTINYMVSNVPNEASHVDPDLICPRGIVIYQNQLWVANMMSDFITNYDTFGNKMLGSIQTRNNRLISSFPSGLAANCAGGFTYNPGNNNINTRYAALLSATKTGDVIAYNPNVNDTNADVVMNIRSGTFNSYTGIAIVKDTMYLANFFRGTIDVYNTDYILQNVPGRNFVDNYSADPIPVDYHPFNIVYIAPFLYVLYAQRDGFRPAAEQIGPGKGFISVYNTEGRFERRFASRGRLNAPWSIIPAPIECGIPPGSFFVSNIGSGEIIQYDKFGNDLGPLLGQSGVPIRIEGLQSMAPHYSEFNTVFFTSSSDPQNRGLIGSLVRDQVIFI
jgi:uncharacterized protein (TIGR03118 family)